MNCLSIDCLPVEILILIFQKLEDNDVLSFILAYPAIIRKYFTVGEYIASKITFNLILNKTGLAIHQNNKEGNTKNINLDSILNFNEFNYQQNFKSIQIENNKIKRKLYRSLKFIPISEISGMGNLKKIKLIHHDCNLLCEVLYSLPISLIVLEIILNGSIKGNWKDGIVSKSRYLPYQELQKEKEIRKKRMNLKLITIINLSKSNKKQFELINVKYIKNQLRIHGPFYSQENIIKFSNKDSIEQKLIHQLGMALSLVILESNLSIQNIGILGIDAIWIMNKIGTEFPQLRIIKAGGDSLSKSIIWAPSILLNNKEKKRFIDDKRLRLMVVIFSKMFNDKCKVILSNNRYIYVSGSGVKLFQEFTYV